MCGKRVVCADIETKEACVLVCAAGSKNRVLAYSPTVIDRRRGMHTADFIVTSYFHVEDGLDAVLPARCPVLIDEGTACTIKGHAWRRRKTGPKFPLRIAKCETHRKHFTLYPHGFGPYARVPVIGCAPGGEDIRPEKPEKPLSEFEDTLFQAALDAQRGVAWARNSRSTIPKQWWSTQLRHLGEAARILGLARDLTDHVRDLLAATLRVPGLLLREHGVASGYRAIGEAVCTVLRQIAGQSPKRALRLLHCRHLATGLRRPRLWDQERRDFERISFQHAGTAAPT